MAGVTRLLVILEEDSRIKLELPNGIPSSVDEVIQEITNFCGLMKYGFNTKTLISALGQDTDTTTKREIALKCLILNMGESVADLIKEFLVSEKGEAGQIRNLRHQGDAQAATKDIGIILEGQEIVNKLASVANAVAILLGFLYALNLEYPKTLKLTFEYIQKVFMELDPKGMATKVKKLYDQLYNRA